jgi:hypothetical protein
MPAGNTYTQIASTTLGSASASVTFSSIPSTYTDLVLIVSVQNNTTPTNWAIQFNGDTAANYSSTFLRGNGTAALSGRNTSNALGYVGVAYSTANIFDFGGVNIQNYSNTTTYKTYLARYGNAPTDGVAARVGLWSSTAAITSIRIFPESNSFSTGSTFNLYGIAAA